MKVYLFTWLEWLLRLVTDPFCNQRTQFSTYVREIRTLFQVPKRIITYVVVAKAAETTIKGTFIQSAHLIVDHFDILHLHAFK